MSADTLPQTLPLAALADNPWQMWPLDPAHVADLAAEVAAAAPLPPIVVRSSPDAKKPGQYQIAVGHHRVAARRQLGLFDIRAEVRPLTDLEMARLTITENFKRRTPSALDKARALQRLIGPPFNLSQTEAGKTLGYANQASVSHVLRLLQLPAPIQAHLHTGALPERLARQLVSLSRSLPAQAVAIAERVAKSDEKEVEFEGAQHDVLRKYGRPMYDAPWQPNNRKGDFTGPPTYVAEAAKKMGLTVLPPCTGCEFHIQRERQSYCARPGCFDAKVIAWRWAQVGEAAKKLGVQLAAPGEAVKPVYIGALRDQQRLAVAALKAKHPSLRLVAVLDKISAWDSDARARDLLLGTNAAALATTDLAALKKALPESATMKGQTRGSAQERKSARDSKWRADQKARAAVRVEIKRVVTVAAEAAAPLLPDHAALLQLIGGVSARYDADWKAAKTLRSKKIAVMTTLLEEGGNSLIPDEKVNYFTPDGMRAVMVATLTALKVKVPAALAAAPAPPQAPSRPRAAPLKRSGRGAPTGKPKAKPKARKAARKIAKAKPKPKYHERQAVAGEKR